MEPEGLLPRSPGSNLPWSIPEFGEDWRGRVKRIVEGCERRDIPGDTNKIHCLT